MTEQEQREILREARERFDQAWEEDRWNRDQAYDDLEFLAGEQWPDNVRAERESANRPLITVNRMPQFLRQVTGDIRRTNPAIAIGPADGEADKDTAEIYEGLTRHIEHMSNATTVYEQAGESAAACSMGWFRVLTEYAPGSFDQDIKIERIPNPFAVYFDPSSRETTRADSDFMFVVEHMSKEKFEAEYPDANEVSWESSNLPEYLRNWYDGDDILVAEYFCKKPIKRTLGQLEDGRVVDMGDERYQALVPVQTREVDDVEVHWYKLSGQEVLDGPVVLPTRYIPVIGVVGEEIHIGERVVRSSVIRYAKDPQRLYNYFRSAQAELIALQPKAPYKVTPKQIEGLERYWEAANTANEPFLPYNPDPNAPPPMRETPPIPSSGMSQEIALAADDMQATTGIYDAALGQRSNEKSGVAIQQRQIESDISTSIYVDNLAKAIQHCGRIIVDMIPKVYDTTRMIRVLGIDDAEKIIEINTPVMTPDGPAIINDLSRGKYDVRISTGPNYTTKRQEAAQAQIEFIRAVPGVAAGVMDLIVKNMDWPGAEEFAERLKRMLPPGLDQRDPSEMTPEEQQAYMMEQQQAQVAQQAQQKAFMLEMADKESVIAERQAKIGKLVAETNETEIDAAIRATELAARNGMIDQIAAQQTIQTLMALGAQQAPMNFPIN